MDIEEFRERILETELFGPALKSQLIEQLHNLDAEKILWLGILLDRAEAAFREFGKTSATYKGLLAEIERSAVKAAEREGDKIFAEFEEQLRDLKL